MITITVVHGWRILRQWLRGPRFWLTAIAFPLLYAGVVNLLFGALVRQFTGDFDPADATILVAVSWAFMLCIMGSGDTLSERDSGIYERFATMPTPYAAALAGRVIVEFVRLIIMMFTLTVVTELVSGSRLLAENAATVIPVWIIVAASAACLGTLVGFSIRTPQGAVAVIPLIVVAMFVNTAMQPAENYRPPLRWLAELTPVSAAKRAITESTLAGWLPLLVWSGFLVIVTVVGLQKQKGKVGSH